MNSKPRPIEEMPVEMPAFVTMTMQDGSAFVFVIAEESRTTLRRFLEQQLRNAAAPPLMILEIRDSMNTRWYHQSK